MSAVVPFPADEPWAVVSYTDADGWLVTVRAARTGAVICSSVFWKARLASHYCDHLADRGYHVKLTAAAAERAAKAEGLLAEGGARG